jgi:hypothetical protein
MRCAEKWTREHKCPSSVQLHVVEELLALFSEEPDTPVYDFEETYSDQVFLALSKGCSFWFSWPKNNATEREGCF